MILRNARLIFPDGIRDGLEVEARNGKITAIRAASASPIREQLDLVGNYLAPGFIDLHIHGALGHDAMDASMDAFAAICRHHASGGTTSLLLTTATAPMAALVKVFKAARDASRQLKPVAGVHVEGPFISKEKPGAQTATLMSNPTPKGYAPLLEHADIVRRVTLAPELPGAIEFIDDLTQHDIRTSAGHSDAWEEHARLAFEHGLRSVTHTFNCMSMSRRRGIDRVAGLLEFAMSEPDIVCELIADGHHVSPTLMKMLYRAKGPRGICLVTDATAGAGLPAGTEFTLSGRRCVVGDGVCLLSDRSALAGSASRMIDLVRVMVNQVGVPLHEAVAMATANPARALGLSAKRRLKPGADADFVILSRDLEVRRTLIAGERVFKSDKL